MVFFNHLLMLLLIDIFCYSLCKNGECHQYDSKDWFCCDNFEMREDICVECRLGYTSFSRKACVPCPNNKYGERCAGICSCMATQRCDHVKGCISNTSTPLNNTTDIFVEGTSIQSSIKTTNSRKRNDPSLKPISIYSISVASLTFMLIIGILLIVYCRRYAGTRSQKSDTKENNIQQTSLTVKR